MLILVFLRMHCKPEIGCKGPIPSACLCPYTLIKGFILTHMPFVLQKLEGQNEGRWGSIHHTLLWRWPISKQRLDYRISSNKQNFTAAASWTLKLTEAHPCVQTVKQTVVWEYFPSSNLAVCIHQIITRDSGARFRDKEVKAENWVLKLWFHIYMKVKLLTAIGFLLHGELLSTLLTSTIQVH